MNVIRKFLPFIYAIILTNVSNSCKDGDTPEPGSILQLSVIRVGTYTLDLDDFSKNTDAPADKAIVASFTSTLDRTTVSSSVKLKEKSSGDNVELSFSFLDEDKTFSAAPVQPLAANTTYELTISNGLRGVNGEKFPGHTVEFNTVPGTIEVTSFKAGTDEVLSVNRIIDVTINSPVLEVTFSAPVNPDDVSDNYFKVTKGSTPVPVALTLSDENNKVTITVGATLEPFTKYQLTISSDVAGAQGETLKQFVRYFYTEAPAGPVFPVISDDELLTLVEQQTFKYFWDFAHPNSGMARERNTSGDVVTSGGSGFGIMAIIVGIERGFITRQEGLDRMDQILDFLETADRFHGAWSHWINGNTGDVIPFSANDNGGDLVETSFLMQGLLTFRQYLDSGVPAESSLIDRINALWEGVEWDWYTQGGQDVLYWHWSPDKGWIMNFPIHGYDEALITYVLAASSPTHTISSSVYTKGWALDGGIVNGNSFYGYTLPVGYNYGGPLFFAHYSFLGLDPRNLSDTYANYWTQNVNHSLINRAYCIDNPLNYAGYSEDSWGLTASDNQQGYSAHSPTNDLGVITPTAALSSFPYTPDESMQALKFFYYNMGDKLWGPYGFYDAFNVTAGWYANSYLAIDEGPIIVMIENHRSQLLWNLFMSSPEVQSGLTKLGFDY